jgi:hypothetical protein
MEISPETRRKRRNIVIQMGIAFTVMIVCFLYLGKWVNQQAQNEQIQPVQYVVSTANLPEETRRDLDFLFYRKSNILTGSEGVVISRKIFQVAGSDIQIVTWAVDLNGRTVGCVDPLGCLTLGDSVHVVVIDQPQSPRNPGGMNYNFTYFAFPLKRFWREATPTSH